MININVSQLKEQFKKGINELSKSFNYKISENQDAINIIALHSDLKELKVNLVGNIATIIYSESIHFYRGFGLLLQSLQDEKKNIDITEQPQFETLGAMFDVSQGHAVINKESTKSLLRRMAIMGLNMLMMYCEDSFDVEDEPYFGYMRSRYSEQDIMELDAYADMLGIEMIPCIQTLAHLADVLKWHTYNDIKEDKETLLVGCDKTYEFIERVIKSAVKPFKTKKIHIGMDEAWKLGLGIYLDQHGLVPKIEIMKEHLSKVIDIVDKLGLEPMMWSDMFFRALNPEGYYISDVPIPENVGEIVPKGTSIVYWDYYSIEEEHYKKFIDQHKYFGETIFAGGIWTWIGFGANWGLTYQTTHPALMACKKNNIKQVFVTIWGDNGTESNVFANMLGLSLYAEHGYSYDFNQEKFEKRFEFCCGANYKDFYDLRLLDEVPGTKQDNLEQVNASKFLMWQDILTGLFDYNINQLPLDQHYEDLSIKFKTAMKRNGEYNSMFEFYYHVAYVLALKSEIGLKITKAYKEQNIELLKEYSYFTLPGLINRVEELRKCHKNNWFNMYKAFGWDVFDMRYGSLLIRIRSAIEQLSAYLDGDISEIEELEETRLPYNSKEGLPGYANFYHLIVSASRIAAEG